MLTQQPCDLSNKSFANSTQQVTDKPQPIHSSQLNDIETDMQLETAHQTPDALSTKNHLSTKEEQKETNLSKLLMIIMYVHTYTSFYKILNGRIAKSSNKAVTLKSVKQD